MKASPQALPAASVVVELLVVDVLGGLPGLGSPLGDALEPRGGVRRLPSAEALRQAWHERRPDLLLIDGADADIDAPAVCAALTRANPGATVPVVVVVDSAEPTRRALFFEAGATDVWIAPLPPAELRARLGGLLGRHDRLGLRRARTERMLRPSTTGHGDEPGRVLLADAHAPARKLLAHHLEAEGWEVVAVDCGRVAQQQIKSERFDAVVLDLELPHRNGFELLELLRGPDAHSQARALVLSAAAQDDHVLRAFRLGADDFVAKPFSPSIVLARLARCLGHTPTLHDDGR